MTAKMLAFLVLPLVSIAALGGAMCGASMLSESHDQNNTEPLSSNEVSSNLRRLADEIESLRRALAAGSTVRTEIAAQPERASCASSDSSAAPLPPLESTALQLIENTAADRALSRKLQRKDKDLARLDELRQQDENERSRAHLLWSYEQVLDRYGWPDATYVSPEGSLHFLYRSETPDSEISFRFHDGYVVRVWAGS
ncbi:MAG: hypothetical protein U1E76_09070 [Planctomycetota bacterium]